MENRIELPKPVYDVLTVLEPKEIRCEVFETGYQKKSIFYFINNDTLVDYIKEYGVNDNIVISMDFEETDNYDFNSDGIPVKNYNIILFVSFEFKDKTFKYNVRIPYFMKRDQIDLADVLVNYFGFHVVVCQNNKIFKFITVPYDLEKELIHDLFKILDRE